MPRSRPLLLTCAFALLVSGCDRQSAQPAQPQEAQKDSTEQLTGKLDRTFAGTGMPAGTLSDPSGKALDLADLKGKPVLLNLWATWCAPCVAELPMLNTLAGDMKGKLSVVTVSEDLTGGDKVKAFLDARKLTNLPQWMDPKNALAIAFGGGSALPLTVLYDAEGKEVWRVMGGYDWSSEQARRNVAEAIKET